MSRPHLHRLGPIAALVAALAASGCTTVGYQALRPDVSTNCVQRLDEVTPVPLTYLAADAKTKPVEFATVSKCVQAPGSSPAPVAMYRLDGVVPPAEVQVSVTLSPGGTLPAAVDVLDAQFRSVQRYGFERFIRRGAQYSLSVFLNASGAPPAYLLVSPDAAHVGKSDTAVGSATNTVPIVAGAGMFMYHSGSETNVVRPFMDGGRIMVTAQPQASAPFSDDKTAPARK